ncbi:MAG: hypothetical protein FD135_2066 [Comamonadaceae bacterium]|nr:MAG: hypothetical protein FD135_2066 [Comamonadaceae bacterium]
MSLSEPTLIALQTLMAQDQELLAHVQAADDADQAAALIAEAATRHGIAVKVTELQTYFAQVSQAAAGQALNDAQLDAVAGGWSNRDTMITLSVLTLGMSCVFFSAAEGAYGIKKRMCEL